MAGMVMRSRKAAGDPEAGQFKIQPICKSATESATRPSLCRYVEQSVSGSTLYIRKTLAGPQIDGGDLVAVILFRVAHAQEKLHSGDHAGGILPDLGMTGVEAQETQLGVVLATFKPCRDKAVPEPVDDSTIVVDSQLSFDGRKQAVAFRGVDHDSPAAPRCAFSQIGFPGCEEVNRFPIAVELGRHRLWRNLAGADHRSHVGFD